MDNGNLTSDPAQATIAVLWDDIEAIEAEMRVTVPTLKENGGYIFSSDHSVPSSVSLDNFRRIVELAKELGSYS